MRDLLTRLRRTTRQVRCRWCRQVIEGGLTRDGYCSPNCRELGEGADSYGV